MEVVAAPDLNTDPIFSGDHHGQKLRVAIPLQIPYMRVQRAFKLKLVSLQTILLEGHYEGMGTAFGGNT